MALLQKRIISRCNQLGKPVLMTRFVDTMVSTPRPTRAGELCFLGALLEHCLFTLDKGCGGVPQR